MAPLPSPSTAIAPPRGPFALRICAGCGEQINDGHHAHEGRLAPVYDVPAVLHNDPRLSWAHRLIEAIDELTLWEPGRRGYAAAVRRLRDERDWAERELRGAEE